MTVVADTKGKRTYATFLLLILNIAGFGAQIYFMSLQGSSFIETYALSLETLQNGVYAAVFTSMFLHGGLTHLGSNLIFLYLFGKPLERRIGGIKILVLYLTSGVLAGLAQVAVSPEIPSIGASGAVAGLLAGAMLLDPGESLMEEIPIIRWFSLPIIRNFFAITFFAATFFLAEAMQTFNTGDGIAHTAHVVGFLTGGFITYYWKPDISIRGILISGIYIALFSLAGAGLLQGQTLPFGLDVNSQIGFYALIGLFLLLLSIRFLSRRGDTRHI